VLGSGDKAMETGFRELAAFSRADRCQIGFDEGWPTASRPGPTAS
jgi:hypothetical protein